MKNIILLGSTGSIGKNVLEVVQQFPGRFRIIGLAAGQNITLLARQVEAFRPVAVSVASEEKARELSQRLSGCWEGNILYGDHGVCEVATLPAGEMVVSAIVGAAGLKPTVAAIEAGKDIALANKETMVMAGEYVNRIALENKVNILPVDSEHNAIFQCLAAGRREDIHKIILTASGGPFRTKSERSLWDVTPEDALNHPNWDMGKKISIDSATLMNKGLEVIEAKWLFQMAVDKIEVIVHPQSIVHSMVEYIDGSTIAQMGVPDMRIPIAYAMTYPERIRVQLPPLDLCKQQGLAFYPPDFKKFPCLQIAYHACKNGGTHPAVLNAANEIAVDAFLEGKIRFPEIALTVAETLKRLPASAGDALPQILDADLSARVQASSVVEALEMNRKQKTGESINSPDLFHQHELNFNPLNIE